MCNFRHKKFASQEIGTFSSITKRVCIPFHNAAISERPPKRKCVRFPRGLSRTLSQTFVQHRYISFLLIHPSDRKPRIISEETSGAIILWNECFPFRSAHRLWMQYKIINNNRILRTSINVGTLAFQSISTFNSYSLLVHNNAIKH